MTGPDFLDSNVLVYAYGTSDLLKQQLVQELVRRAIAGEILASTQVLGEFAATLLHKLTPPAGHEDVLAILDALGPIKLVALDGDIVRRAVEAQRTYGIPFYDGMIVAKAERGGCLRIWSEDLSAGQKYFEVVVTNPFA